MKKKNKVLMLITMLFLVLGLVGAAYDVSAASKQTGFVNGGNQTIVYSSYNKNSKVVGKINRGEKLTSATLHSQNWYYVQYKNIKGYVSVGEVILDKTPNSYNGVGKLTSSVYSYVSADNRSKVARTIKNGTSVDIIGIVGKWYQIKIGSSIEYITNENIKVSATESVTVFNADAVVNSPANVVHVPNALGKIQTTYTRGTTLIIVGQTTSFYKIKYGNTFAFVLKNRVTETSIQEDMRGLSSQAYNTNTNSFGSWTYYSSYTDKSSLQFKVFRKLVSGNAKDEKYDYVFAYRGTQEKLDYVVDVLEVVGGLEGIQTHNAVSETKKIIKKENKNINKVYFTGHSLGGYLAAWVESDVVEDKFSDLPKNKSMSYTFNAPGLWPGGLNISSQAKIINDKFQKYDEYIKNYYIKNDGISLFGKHLGATKGFNNPTKNWEHKLANFDSIKSY